MLKNMQLLSYLYFLILIFLSNSLCRLETTNFGTSLIHSYVVRITDLYLRAANNEPR